MIDLTLCMSVFNQYFKKFDIKNPNILKKFHHSYRVMEYSKDIARCLDLTYEEIALAQLIGLVHDIGRFTQWRDYQTYYDCMSVDHGELSRKVLLEDHILDDMHIDNELYSIILDAVSNHNKYSIDSNLDEISKKFAQIIRDADKIDIFLEQANYVNDGSNEIKESLYNDLINHKSCLTNYKVNDLEHVIRCIGFLFDMNFDYSIKYLNDKEAINNKLHLIELYLKNKNMVENIKKIVINYVEEKILC